MKCRTLFCAVMVIAAGFSTQFVFADDLCAKRVPIGSLFGVLYKNANIHGDRGPTFLVQNAGERTHLRSLEIRDVNCKKISSFGLFAANSWPYGDRYYEVAKGGSRNSAAQLLSLAKKAGSTNILVRGVHGKWIVVQSPLNDEGVIFK